MDGGFSAFYVTGFTAGEILGEGGVVIFDITVLCEPRGKVRTSDESGFVTISKTPSQTPFMPSLSNFSGYLHCSFKPVSADAS